MSRELRRVPGHWQHPIKYRRPDGWTTRGQIAFVGLMDGYEEDLESFRKDQSRDPEFYPDSDAPKPEWYCPQWPAEERTHYQLYETVSEGSPVSPVFATAEELVRFLVDEGEWFSEQRYEEASARLLVGSGWAPTMAGNEHGLHGPETYARLQSDR